MKLFKKLQPEWFVYVLLLYPFLFGALNDLLGLPNAIRYIMDVTWGVLTLQMLWGGRSIDFKGIKLFILWIVVFVAYTLLAYLANFQSPLYYLWGFRNNFRFYAAFLAFAVFATPAMVDKFFKLLDYLFWINFVLTLFQNLVLDVWQDFLGGIFGTQAGVNGYTIPFMILVITMSVLRYLKGQEKLWVYGAKCAAALVIAALAELKFFVVAFVLIVAMAVGFSGINKKHLLVAVVSCGAALLSAVVIGKIYPYFAGWYEVGEMVEIVSSEYGYTSSGDINRLTAISTINELWLTDWSQRLFGMGLGNSDTSSFAFLNTPFYLENGEMHYTWVSYAMMYLECGWIGLLLYFGFFGLVFLAAAKVEKRCEGNARLYCTMAKVTAPMCCLLAIYNSSLRTEAAYMMYFVLALPLVFSRHNGADRAA